MIIAIWGRERWSGKLGLLGNIIRMESGSESGSVGASERGM
jgi:hypothetical protein